MTEEVVKKVGRPKKTLAKPTAKFEFACLELPKDSTPAERAALMRPFGAVGGELVSVVAGYDGTHYAYFMCEVK